MDENTPFNQTPDCIRFDTLNHIEEDYQITTRNLSKMALNGKIKFYGQPPSSWCLEGFVLPIDTPVDYKNTMRPPDDNGLICFTQKEITTFYYTGQIKLIRAVLARERNIISQSHGYNIHTKNMIIIDTQELEQALALTKSGATLQKTPEPFNLVAARILYDKRDHWTKKAAEEELETIFSNAKKYLSLTQKDEIIQIIYSEKKEIREEFHIACKCFQALYRSVDNKKSPDENHTEYIENWLTLNYGEFSDNAHSGKAHTRILHLVNPNPTGND